MPAIVKKTVRSEATLPVRVMTKEPVLEPSSAELPSLTMETPVSLSSIVTVSLAFRPTR